ncbi:hypothetical protein [Seonamhaeicola sp. ML3]|uniref:hypothetical protein n=1 Tax=Seonamhaeicola sp. ML3 TaxID=2937786 RepID=UPI00200D3EAF|nr:hypothetical protein [Seonamhaeicola sp. ML3]
MTEILEKLSKESLSGTEIGEIFGNPSDFPNELVENLSVKTAVDFWNGEIDFEDGDMIMNNLQTFWVTNEHFVKNFGFGEVSWICYEAFDAGEYIRPTDHPNTDPIEKYTKPILENLLRELNKIE